MLQEVLKVAPGLKVMGSPWSPPAWMKSNGETVGGGLRPEFYAAYNKAYPLDAGYEKRKHLYNLYHLLNHLNLFGSGYLGQVKATLSLLRL